MTIFSTAFARSRNRCATDYFKSIRSVAASLTGAETDGAYRLVKVGVGVRGWGLKLRLSLGAGVQGGAANVPYCGRRKYFAAAAAVAAAAQRSVRSRRAQPSQVIYRCALQRTRRPRPPAAPAPHPPSSPHLARPAAAAAAAVARRPPRRGRLAPRGVTRVLGARGQQQKTLRSPCGPKVKCYAAE